MHLKPEKSPATPLEDPHAHASCFYAWERIDTLPTGATRQQRVESGARHARQLCAALLAKITRSDARDWCISPPGQGIPTVLAAGAGLDRPGISLSHSGDSVAAAVSWQGDPGIDIQVVDGNRDYEALAAYMGWIPALGEGRHWRHGSRFTRTWTQWECWIKAMATPLPVDPAWFRQVLEKDRAARTSQAGTGYFRTLRTPGGWLSLALGRNQRLVAGTRFRRVSEPQLHAASGQT